MQGADRVAGKAGRLTTPRPASARRCTRRRALNARAGIKTVHVPYQGSPQAVTDLLRAVSMMVWPASAGIPNGKAGKLKALASATRKRPSIAPDLPTMAEAGLPEFDASIWFGLMAPVGTPQPIIDKLAAAANEALKSDEAKASYAAQGFDLLGGGPADMARTIATDTERWTIAAQAAGLKK